MKLAKFLLQLFFIAIVCLPTFVAAYLVIHITFYIYYLIKKIKKWKITMRQRFRHR
jgi:hypothetical protein